MVIGNLFGVTGEGLTPQDVAGLQRVVQGPVLLPGSAAYDEECSTYNLACRLRPAVVVGATGQEDVQAAVRFAASRGLPVAVKSAAHQVVTSAHGGLLITLKRMRGMDVDARARTVRVEPGVRWRDVLPRTAKFGLAPIVGSAPDVSVVGYTLGGGQSPLLGRTLGYAADHVHRFDIVTADGELRRVTPRSEPDLFWAVLGGKGNFGVVTDIEFEVFPVTHFYGGGIYFPAEHLAEVLEVWRSWLPTVGTEMTTSIGIQRLPDVPVLPHVLRGVSVVHLRIGYVGSATEGAELVAPLRAAAPVLLDLVEEKPFSSIGEIHMDPVDPMPYYDRSLCLEEFDAEAARTLVALTGSQSGCTLANVEIRALGGALDHEPKFPNAVPSRGLPYVVFGFAVGAPEQAATLRAELARVMEGLAPWAARRNLVNFLSPDEATDADGVRAAYGADRYRLLTDIKKRYDPDNMFRFNHNIAPV